MVVDNKDDDTKTIDRYESCSTMDSGSAYRDMNGDGASLFKFMIIMLTVFTATVPVLIWRRRRMYGR